MARLNRAKGARRRGRLSVEVVPPAEYGSVRAPRAGVFSAGCDLDEAGSTRCTRDLAGRVIAPADDGAIARLEAAAKIAAGGQLEQRHPRRVRDLIERVVSPTIDQAIVEESAGVGVPRPEQREAAVHAPAPGAVARSRHHQLPCRNGR